MRNQGRNNSHVPSTGMKLIGLKILQNEVPRHLGMNGMTWKEVAATFLNNFESLRTNKKYQVDRKELNRLDFTVITNLKVPYVLN